MIMKFSCIAKQKMLNILDSLYTTYTCHSLYSTTYLYIAHTTEALYLSTGHHTCYKLKTLGLVNKKNLVLG